MNVSACKLELILNNKLGSNLLNSYHLDQYKISPLRRKAYGKGLTYKDIDNIIL